MSRTVEVTDQGSFIPASQRPDGSWRKPRRVKEGYVPQEEVPLYESRGKQWRESQVRQYPVGYDPSIIRAKEEAKQAAVRTQIPGLVIETEGKKKKKKKKGGETVVNEQPQSKNAKTETVVNSNSEAVDEWQTVQSKSAKNTKATESSTQNAAPAMVDPSKRLKNLKKKLREIEAIEAKIATGEIKKPDKDQVDKVNRKADVLSEIFALELSVDQ
ncbi:partner of Y14 and mago [Homalodisca vitripennis]|uniref:partner of Y14 and mago n=1 Tax=Homalodisca vitripennis TaxID=197043 RepID=UPI001EE9CFF1|nr:partner of Y14 and mago [Homalodisca vitripennis]